MNHRDRYLILAAAAFGFAVGILRAALEQLERDRRELERGVAGAEQLLDELDHALERARPGGVYFLLDPNLSSTDPPYVQSDEPLWFATTPGAEGVHPFDLPSEGPEGATGAGESGSDDPSATNPPGDPSISDS